MRTRLVAAAVASTVGLVGLGGAIAVPLAASAVTGSSDPADGGPEDPGTSGEDRAELGERAGERVLDALSGLVDDGTITQEQAEAVADALVEQAPPRAHGPREGGPHEGGRHEGGPHEGGGPGGAGPRGTVDSAAEVLGVPAGEVREALREGATLAELAEDAGVDPQEVVDALVADAEERLDEAVADGRLDADEAADRLAEMTEWMAEIVFDGLPARPWADGGWRPGPGGAGQSGTSDGVEIETAAA